MPEEKPSNNPNNPFPTPDPKELQSEKSKASVRETLAKDKETENNVIDNSDVDRRDVDDSLMKDYLGPTGLGSSSPSSPD